MKKLVATLLCLIAFSALALGAQSLKDNPYYQKSLELKAQASQAFDGGEYDLAADYAAQAKEQAALSDAYVEKMLARSSAYKVLSQAKSKLAEADGRGWKTMYADQFAVAAGLTTEAGTAFDAEDYALCSDKSKAAIEATEAIVKLDAEAAIAQAKDAMSNAEKIEAPANFPKEWAQATTAMNDAQAAYDSQDYPSAAARARACVAALAGVHEIAKVAPPPPAPVPEVAPDVWPAVYVVRLIPQRRDCLWRIAEYPFIYNNPLKWPVIYQANKKTFRDPGNPNLIFPGQKLKIPSINGEQRDGTYDPTKQYKAFPKPVKATKK
jgi:hypothetical protein